jgi:ketosteroid isomerase-like protein
MTASPAPRAARTAMLATMLAASACATSTIGNTDIKDTEENRQVLELVERYHRAIESLDADAVLELVSPDFYEDLGNGDEGDDYDYEGLAQSLHENFELTRTLRLDIRVDAVEIDDDAGTAYAELYFDIRAQNEYPSGLKWERTTDRTRLRLRREGDTWRIIAGL